MFGDLRSACHNKDVKRAYELLEQDPTHVEYARGVFGFVPFKISWLKYEDLKGLLEDDGPRHIEASSWIGGRVYHCGVEIGDQWRERARRKLLEKIFDLCVAECPGHDIGPLREALDRDLRSSKELPPEPVGRSITIKRRRLYEVCLTAMSSETSKEAFELLSIAVYYAARIKRQGVNEARDILMHTLFKLIEDEFILVHDPARQK